MRTGSSGDGIADPTHPAGPCDLRGACTGHLYNDARGELHGASDLYGGAGDLCDLVLFSSPAKSRGVTCCVGMAKYHQIP